MKAINKQPKIRFKGFTDAWEQCEFKDIANRSSEKSDVDNLPRVEYEDIISEAGQLNKDISLKECKKSGIVFYEGDVLYGKLRPYLHNWLLPLFTGIAVGDFWVLTPQICDSIFLYELIQTRMFNDVANQSAGTKMPRADWKLVSKTRFYIPIEKKEQQKIGKYFESLDKSITLHQRKCEELKLFKKSMLAKMFPKEGETVPEVRFAGFTDEWIKKSLEEVVERFDNLRVPVSEINRKKGKIPYYGANGIQDYVDGYTHNGEYILIAEDGANDIKNYPVHYVNGKVWVNNHAHVLQGKQNKSCTLFLKYGLNQINMGIYLVGGGRAKLNSNIMMNIEINLPSNIEEQQKIGSYFKYLDDMINLHQQKVENLQNIKKSLLDNMFV